MTPDPYEPYLRQADTYFAQGEIVKAGQIWQAILKQQPSHAEARQKLVAVKARLLAQREADAAASAPSTPAPPAETLPAPPSAEEPAPHPEPVPTAQPQEAPPPGPDPARLLAEGCTLYDMGQLEDALLKWEHLLALEPTHTLARSYANGARRELGRPPLEAPSEPQEAAIREAPLGEDEDLDKILREAVQLYDMGLTEDAIRKWERALALAPHRDEIEGYLRQARIELGQAAPQPAPAPAPAHASPSEPEGLELKLRQAEHLLTLQRPEEAAYTFQQALALDPGNPRALQGLTRCKRPAEQPDPEATRALHAAPEPQSGGVIRLDPAAASDTGSYTPPAALLKPLPPPRQGMPLPARLRQALDQAPWLKEPKRVAALAGGTVILVLASTILLNFRKEKALQEAVQAAKAQAVAPLGQQTQGADLNESLRAIEREAEDTLVTDPLRAYLRAETLVARNSGDARAAQLLEKARAGLAGGVVGASLPEFQKHLQQGDLEAAAKVMDALLRAQPDDEGLRSRAARLELALCSVHAAQAKWDAAREDLLRGRALFPGDKAWQARLLLLERVKAMPKPQQAHWIALLG